MSEEQRREVEQAREQSRLSAEKFEKVFQATEPPRRAVPAPESVPHRKFKVSELEVKAPPPPERQRNVPAHVQRAEGRRGPRGPRGRMFRGDGGFFLSRRRHGIVNAPGSPANITGEEKRNALGRINRALALWNRRYAFRVVHGATPSKVEEAAGKVRQLEADKRSVTNMEPVPAHIRRAEQSL